MLKKWLILLGSVGAASSGFADQRPNILFCISDDQSYAHAGANGDPVVQTPTFDRVAHEGIRFTHAFANAPSCGPSRHAIITGQDIWRLEEGGNIHSFLPTKFKVYQDLLKEAGYVVGSTGKGVFPSNHEVAGRKQDMAGVPYKRFHYGHRDLKDIKMEEGIASIAYARNFGEFLEKRPRDKPFSFWLGTWEAHRDFGKGVGLKHGMDPSKVVVPPWLPDHKVVREDMLDYYYEIQHFDTEVGKALALLEARGELDNTIVVMTSDNGMAFPRAKASLYDSGTHMPLAIRWPKGIQSQGRDYEGFVLLSDLAPTFLEAAGLEPLKEMTATSLMEVFASPDAPKRDAAFLAMERHDGARKGGKGYPMRGIRTEDYLYIRNFEPSRWPSGSPDADDCARAIPYGEIDSAPSKDLLMNTPEFGHLAKLAFGMRPADELYDVKNDPGNMNNLAGLPRYAEIEKALKKQLFERLEATGDPRVTGGPILWDYYEYYGEKINKDWAVDELP